MTNSATSFRRMSQDRGRWHSLRQKGSRIPHLVVRRIFDLSISNHPCPTPSLIQGILSTVSVHGRMIDSQTIPHKPCPIIIRSMMEDTSMAHIHPNVFEAGTSHPLLLSMQQHSI